jgi:hypothetical protein
MLWVGGLEVVELIPTLLPSPMPKLVVILSEESLIFRPKVVF